MKYMILPIFLVLIIAFFIIRSKKSKSSLQGTPSDKREKPPKQ